MATLPPGAQSDLLSRRALIALNRLGDLMLPRYEDFPSFSETGCVQFVDDIVLYAPADDVKSLGIFLTLLSFCPDFVLKLIINLTQRGQRMQGPLGPLLRLLDMGIRSVIVTLYFSGKTAKGFTGKSPLQLTGYETTALRP
jgi:hypothetical protein